MYGFGKFYNGGAEYHPRSGEEALYAWFAVKDHNDSHEGTEGLSPVITNSKLHPKLQSTESDHLVQAAETQ